MNDSRKTIHKIKGTLLHIRENHPLFSKNGKSLVLKFLAVKLPVLNQEEEHKRSFGFFSNLIIIPSFVLTFLLLLVLILPYRFLNFFLILIFLAIEANASKEIFDRAVLKYHKLFIEKKYLKMMFYITLPILTIAHLVAFPRNWSRARDTILIARMNYISFVELNPTASLINQFKAYIKGLKDYIKQHY